MIRKPHTLAALLLAAGSAVSQSAQACSSDPFLGTICTFGFNFCPRGYAPANGQLLAISSNQALFSLLGTQFGGDGRTTFALPDLQGRVMLGSGQGSGLSPVGVGQRGGTETVTLSTLQMPAHTHAATTTVSTDTVVRTVPGAGNTTAPTGAVWAASSTRDKVYSTSGPTQIMSADAVQTTASAVTNVALSGGNQPIGIRQPWLGVTTCIATEGIYPSRN